MSNDTTAAIGPDEALELLKAGNSRFVAGDVIERNDYPQQRAGLTDGQAPFATGLPSRP